MIRRWRPKFSFPPSNVPPIVGLYLLHPAANPAGDTNPQKSYHFKPETTTNWRQDANRTIPKLTVVTPQTVLTTLYNCTSDLIALSFFIWCAKQPHFFHDKEAFRHMVSVVANLTNRHATVRAIIGELEAIGCPRKAQTFLLLMRIYWYGDMYDMVLESFQEMYNYGYVPNAYVRNIVMDVLFKTGRVDDAMKVLEETQAYVEERFLYESRNAYIGVELFMQSRQARRGISTAWHDDSFRLTYFCEFLEYIDRSVLQVRHDRLCNLPADENGEN